MPTSNAEQEYERCKRETDLEGQYEGLSGRYGNRRDAERDSVAKLIAEKDREIARLRKVVEAAKKAKVRR